MKAFRFAAYPNNESVASGMTVLVSAWFVVAACAILGDSVSTTAPVTMAGIDRAAPITTARMDVESLQPANLVVPDVHYRITVQARRTAT